MSEFREAVEAAYLAEVWPFKKKRKLRVDYEEKGAQEARDWLATNPTSAEMDARKERLRTDIGWTASRNRDEHDRWVGFYKVLKEQYPELNLGFRGILAHRLGESFVKTRQPHQRMRKVIVDSTQEQHLLGRIQQLGTIWETTRSGGKTTFMIATRWYPQQLEDFIPGADAYEDWE